MSLQTDSTLSRTIKPVFTALICALICACGWQLRGYEPGESFNQSNIRELRIFSLNRDNAFFRRLSSTLKRNDITERSDAEFAVEIFGETIDRKPLAYNRIGTPSQYKMTVSIDYRVLKANGVVIPKTTLTSRRNYDFDPNLIIAKDKEQEELVFEMRGELSQRIIDSLNGLQP